MRKGKNNAPAQRIALRFRAAKKVVSYAANVSQHVCAKKVGSQTRRKNAREQQHTGFSVLYIPAVRLAPHGRVQLREKLPVYSSGEGGTLDKNSPVTLESPKIGCLPGRRALNTAHGSARELWVRCVYYRATAGKNRAK